MAMIVLTPVIGLTWGLYQIRNRKYESLNDSIALLVPDTVHHYDTIPPVDSIRWIDSTVLHYITIYDTIRDNTLNFYNDSVVNNELAIYLHISGTGLMD